MTAGLLNDIYNGKSHLDNINIEELRTLVVQYPYFHHLRYLLAKKSDIIANNSRERDLKLASVYAHDQKVLFDYISGKKKLFI